MSSISDEINHNSVKGKYDPQKAQHKAYVKRHYASFRGKKIVAHDKLRDFIESNPLDVQSHGSIAGRIKYQEK